MNQGLNLSELNRKNQDFLSKCKEIGEYDTFCEIISHNDRIVKGDDVMVPYISSDIYAVHNKEIVYTYAKQMPFSEMLTEFWKEIPKAYNKVFFNRSPHFEGKDVFKKMFFTEICFDH